MFRSQLTSYLPQSALLEVKHLHVVINHAINEVDFLQENIKKDFTLSIVQKLRDKSAFKTTNTVTQQIVTMIMGPNPPAW